jgi:hypothetical protein
MSSIDIFTDLEGFRDSLERLRAALLLSWDAIGHQADAVEYAERQVGGRVDAPGEHEGAAGSA